MSEVNTHAFHQAVIGGLTDAITAYGQHHGLPRLAWGPTSGEAELSGNPSRSDLPEHAHERSAEAWAEHLGLVEDTHPLAHSRSWQGRVGWMRVQVWACLNWDAWEADLDQIRQDTEHATGGNQR